MSAVLVLALVGLGLLDGTSFGTREEAMAGDGTDGAGASAA
ncbi:hypothetical protein ACFHW2_34950 [Actinomadura sp. LOL_016]